MCGKAVPFRKASLIPTRLCLEQRHIRKEIEKLTRKGTAFPHIRRYSRKFKPVAKRQLLIEKSG